MSRKKNEASSRHHFCARSGGGKTSISPAVFSRHNQARPPHQQEVVQDSRSCSLIGKKVSMVSPLRTQHFLPRSAPCCYEISAVVVQDSYRLVWISCRHGMEETLVSCTQIWGFILARQPSRRYHHCANFSGRRGVALGKFGQQIVSRDRFSGHHRFNADYFCEYLVFGDDMFRRQFVFIHLCIVILTSLTTNVLIFCSNL
jgi:hypothetical protein